MIAVVVIAGIPLVVALVDAVRRPTFRRLAVRNVMRRKGEAALVVLGSLLGTAIITSSFVVGDTLHASVREQARSRLGPIDETVLVHDANALPEALARVTATPLPRSDGVTTEVTAAATVATPPDSSGQRRAEPEAFVNEVDFDAARHFGGAVDDTGFAGAGATPAAGEIVLGHDLASELGVGAGDEVDVFLYGQPTRLRVRETVPRLGVAGFHADFGQRSMVAFVAPGTLTSLAASRPSTAQPPQGRVLVSNDGGVFDGATHTDAMLLELKIRTAPMADAAVNDDKQSTLDFADRISENFTRLFSLIGSFSVVAGILLLVNIFVMLAQERKPELGMLRALGLKRNHLVRAFGLEGTLYALAAAIAGTVVGVALGRVLVQVTASIFTDRDRGFDLTFAVRPSSLVIGFGAGLAVSVLTVWGTSAAIGRLNVIRAIRDVPDPPRQGRRLGGLLAAAAGVVLGAVLFASGVAAKAPVPALIGPAMASWCAVPLLGRLVGRRWAVSIPCALALVYAIGVFSLLPSVFERADVSLFFVQGLVLVGSAVALAVVNDDQFHWITDRLSSSGRGLAARLGLANPLARRFRTSLLLGMYALIVFVLVFMAVFAAVFDEQAPKLADDARAGYDARVDSAPTAPVTPSVLLQQRDVTAVAPLLVAEADVSGDRGRTTRRRGVTGFDESLLARGVPKLSSRDKAYATDADAWRAVLASPDLVIAPSDLLAQGGPGNTPVSAGDTLTVIDPGSARRHALRVVGVDGDFDVADNGAMVGAANLPSLVNGSAPSRFYVAVAPGADAATVATQIEGSLLANAATVDTFRSLVDERLSGQMQFIALLQGFIALGLLIGIAGLGVVMVRAVRERRREIGMLRALGFPARVVRTAFLVEASFVALQGTVLGVVLGLVTGYAVLSHSSTFGDDRLPFTVPWLPVTVLCAAALGASLLAVLGPATQASRIRPAAALRIAD